MQCAAAHCGIFKHLKTLTTHRQTLPDLVLQYVSLTDVVSLMVFFPSFSADSNLTSHAVSLSAASYHNFVFSILLCVVFRMTLSISTVMT